MERSWLKSSFILLSISWVFYIFSQSSYTPRITLSNHSRGLICGSSPRHGCRFVPILKGCIGGARRDQSGHTCITYIAKPKYQTQGDSKSYSLIKNVHVCDMCMGMCIENFVDGKRKIKDNNSFVYLLLQFSLFGILRVHGYLFSSLFFFIMPRTLYEQDSREGCYFAIGFVFKFSTI